VTAAVEERPGARGTLEREAAADGRSRCDRLRLPRGPHELDDPAQEQLVDVDVLDRTLERPDLGARDDGLEVGERVAVPLRDDDGDLLVLARIAERRLEREPVELRLGQ